MSRSLRILTFAAITLGLLILSGPGAAIPSSAPPESAWVQVTDDGPAWQQEDEGPSIADVVAAAHKPGSSLQVIASNGR